MAVTLATSDCLSTVEAEYSAAYVGGTDVVYLQLLLQELRHEHWQLLYGKTTWHVSTRHVLVLRMSRHCTIKAMDYSLCEMVQDGALTDCTWTRLQLETKSATSTGQQRQCQGPASRSLATSC
jgi:hypothetical protein